VADLVTAGRVSVIGEALIDLVPGDGPAQFLARPGGSPLNVAVGLARLGRPTSLLARLADTEFGRLLRRHAEDEGIDLSHAVAASQPATLAVVSLDEKARASYDFYLEGGADWQWTSAELRDLPAGTEVLHFGSLAAWTPPGDAAVLDLAARTKQAGRVLVSYDPNVRPSLFPEASSAHITIEAAVAVAHVVKASREDIDWLYPGAGASAVARRWTALGVLLVVITDGADGAHAFTADGADLTRPGRRINLVDTVGAGDAFTSGLLNGLVRRGLHHLDGLGALDAAQLSAVLDEAITVSAITCERVGADPPRAADLPGFGSC
jgi:fructokinase